MLCGGKDNRSPKSRVIYLSEGGNIVKLSTLMVINAVVSLVFGVGFALIPAQILSLYGVTADSALIYVGRLLGAAFISLGVLTWLAKNVAEAQARRAIVLALFVGEGIGFIVALIGQLAGAMNALGWSTVAIYLLLALGFGYFAFLKPSDS